MKPQHIVSVSGGKDSTAVYLLAVEKQVPFRAIFADTGNEHDATYEYVERLHELTGGPKVEWVKADFTDRLAKHRQYILEKWPGEGIAPEIVTTAAAINTPTGNQFLDLCILKGRFPSRMAQFCTMELKELPIVEHVVFPALRNGQVLQWLGIRAEESARRAKQPRWNHHDSGSYVWRPIFRWTIEDVWAIHRKHGLFRNPLYDLGANRVGCMPCINSRKDEIRQISERWPEHIERIARWERILAVVSKRGGSTFFAPLRDSTPNSIEVVVEWSKTKRGGEFFNAQSGGGCNSDLALCERAMEGGR